MKINGIPFDKASACHSLALAYADGVYRSRIAEGKDPDDRILVTPTGRDPDGGIRINQPSHLPSSLFSSLPACFLLMGFISCL